MEREKISSSNIDSIGYDQQKLILEVQFTNGGIYQYFEVPKEIFNKLMSADSKGRFLHKFIINKFKYACIS